MIPPLAAHGAPEFAFTAADGADRNVWNSSDHRLNFPRSSATRAEQVAGSQLLIRACCVNINHAATIYHRFCRASTIFLYFFPFI